MPIGPGLVRRGFADLVDVASPSARDQYLAAMFMGLMARGPRESEVVEVIEGALALDAIAPVSLRPAANRPSVVLAGSGKKNVRSPNVSTPSAIVAAAAGARVVKVGSHSTSSTLGSRDLAVRLGIPQSRTSAEIEAALHGQRFAFVPIEDAVPALDRVYGGRFHVVNPLSFGFVTLAAPVRGDAVLYGLAHPRVDLAARVLRHFGIRDALVVTSETYEGHFVDEFGMGRRSLVSEVRDGQVRRPVSYDADQLPGDGAWPEEVDGPLDSEDAVRMAMVALSGRTSPQHRRLIAWNAAFVLTAGGAAEGLEDGYRLACSAIENGEATRHLETLTGGSA